MDIFISLLTLTGLEIVLGIDNIVLLAILTEKLPPEQQAKARRLGLFLALIFRILLLATVAWLTQLTTPILEVFEQSFSTRDLILLSGGLFLIAKATSEIYEFVHHHHEKQKATHTTMKSVLIQIIIFDMIFSLDSVLTAVGLVDQLWVMVTAVIVSIIVMIIFAEAIARFVKNNPGIKILALSFLILIGVLLVAEGFDSHFDRGYVYFAMVFALTIELLKKKYTNKMRT